MSLVERLHHILEEIRILPRRLSLATPGVQATLPMLRGVWGAALHDLDPEAYRVVFEGGGYLNERTPTFVLRPAPPDPEDAPALEWVLIGKGLAHDDSLLRAWDVASGMGLGPKRSRFLIRAMRPYGPSGQLLPPSRETLPWLLSRSTWPLPGPPERGPCRLSFPAPLRLIRRHRLIDRPALPDLVVAALRRLRPFLPERARQNLTDLEPGLLDLARRLPAAPWEGRRLDLVRYSGRQKQELEMRGVAGRLDLPEGPGELWPLFAAAQWLHLGKGTAVGMGQLLVEPLAVPER